MVPSLVTSLRLPFRLVKNLVCEEHGLGEGVVLSLVKPIKNQNCLVYVNNYFNTLLLQHNLLQCGDIYFVATFKTFRKQLPKDDKYLVTSA